MNVINNYLPFIILMYSLGPSILLTTSGIFVSTTSSFSSLLRTTGNGPLRPCREHLATNSSYSDHYMYTIL